VSIKVVSNQEGYDYKGFNWDFVAIKNDELYFNLSFPNVLLVSKAKVPD
jgi:hypothetical protein